MVYLDHAATSPLCAEARAAMEPYLDDRFGNASEPHGFGRAAREGWSGPGARSPSCWAAEPGQVIFTSGGSEADNQAVFGLAGRPLGRLVVSDDRALGRARAPRGAGAAADSRWPGSASTATA